MYNRPYHKETNSQVIDNLIKQYPLAFLTGCDSENKPVATQVPLFIEEANGQKLLRGHIMKNNDHYKAFLNNKNILAVFTGKNTYVSGTWYSNTYTPSTWNYMSVHIKGNLRFVNESELEDILRVTSLYFENQNEESTTTFDKLPTEFKRKALKMIVGFEIEIIDINTVFKLSQDQDIKSYQNIIKKLEKQDGDARVIAEEMKKREKGLFSKKKTRNKFGL